MSFMLDDNYPDHPKIEALSDAAFRLHTAALFYARRHLTDGAIPATRVPRLAPSYSAKTLAELVRAGLWYKQSDGSYLIHDWLQWNDPREVVLAEKQRLHDMRSQAGKKGAATRWGAKTA